MKRLIICFLILFLTACHQNLERTLDIAESLLNDRPDSALSLLNGIHPEDRGIAREYARYALLKSAACDKNYIDVASDSLIAPSVDYYSTHKDVRHRMLAYYYHGIVLKNATDYTASIISFEKAEKDALALKDFHYLGLIYRNIGELYTATHNIPAAIESLRKAVHYSSLSGEVPYQSFAEITLAYAYINNKEYDNAQNLLAKIRETYNDPVLTDYCLLHEAEILTIQGSDPAKAVRLYAHVPEKYFRAADFISFAQAYEDLGKKDSADFWISRAYATVNSRQASANVGYMHARILAGRRDFEHAYPLVIEALSVQDSVTRFLLGQSVSGSLRDYYKGETLLQESRLKSVKQAVGLWVMVIVLSIIAVFLYIRKRSVEKDAALKDALVQLSWAKQQNKEMVETVFSGGFGYWNQLVLQYANSLETQERESVLKMFKDLIKTMQNDPQWITALETKLDEYCDGVMTKLRDQVPAIRKENRKIIALFFAGFSNETVRVLLNRNSAESMKTARSRFRNIIKEAKAPDEALFLEMLNVRKR